MAQPEQVEEEKEVVPEGTLTAGRHFHFRYVEDEEAPADEQA